MPDISNNPDTYKEVADTGHCARFVQVAANAPLAAPLRQGDLVIGNFSVAPRGTAIATFDENGKYPNKTDGSSHAVIYIGQDATGINVYDQWIGHSVSTCKLRFDGASEAPEQ